MATLKQIIIFPVKLCKCRLVSSRMVYFNLDDFLSKLLFTWQPFALLCGCRMYKDCLLDHADHEGLDIMYANHQKSNN